MLRDFLPCVWSLSKGSMLLSLQRIPIAQRLWTQAAQACSLALSVTSCVLLGKSLNSCVPQFPHYPFSGSLRGLYEVSAKPFEQCLPQSEGCVRSLLSSHYLGVTNFCLLRFFFQDLPLISYPLPLQSTSINSQAGTSNSSVVRCHESPALRGLSSPFPRFYRQCRRPSVLSGNSLDTGVRQSSFKSSFPHLLTI